MTDGDSLTAVQGPPRGEVPPSRPRAVVTLSAAVEAVAQEREAERFRVRFGIPALDEALGGLTPGAVTLLAGLPETGVSLLAGAAARTTALHELRPVLYGACGVRRGDLVLRMAAAESRPGAGYAELRAGRLPAQEARRVLEVLKEGGGLLHIDDGEGLDAAALAAHARAVEPALVVVDRLHHLDDPGRPLSGPHLPSQMRELAALARELDVPVLAVLDTDEEQETAALDPEVTVRLTTVVWPPGHVQAQITERDMGQMACVTLTLESDRARHTSGVLS
jgi:replicative DNA helicase